MSWDDDEADVSEEYEPTKHKESTYSSPLARFFDWFFGGVEESQHPEDKYEEQDNGADEEIDDGGDKKGFLSFLFSDEEERENRRPSNYNTNRREKRRQKKKKRSRLERNQNEKMRFICLNVPKRATKKTHKKEKDEVKFVCARNL